MKQETIKLNSKRVRTALASFNETEFGYAKLQMAMAEDAKNLVEKFNLSKERFCELIAIPLNKYDSYLNGSYDYSIKEMASMRCAWFNLNHDAMTEQLEQDAEKATVGVNVKYKYQQPGKPESK